jgi:four helix bundle protein
MEWDGRMDEAEMKRRTKIFAIRCMKLADSLPATVSGRAIASQLVRCGTSVGANYRSACRGRSKAEFISKLGIVEEEADESAYWMEIIAELEMKSDRVLRPLRQEAEEIVRMIVASIRSVRSSIQNPKSKIQNR